MPLIKVVLTEKQISYMVNVFYLCLDFKQLLGILYIYVYFTVHDALYLLQTKQEKVLLGTKIYDTLST